ncbi:PPR repeat [Musa troglodytarum]|uniref:PPR repeat n=1 Tax=Musa troglodytarum TaxID=320322 RepID=A0A9E7J948_9LILI|nr:PPR repeat [Musa troglodytarum]
MKVTSRRRFSSASAAALPSPSKPPPPSFSLTPSQDTISHLCAQGRFGDAIALLSRQRRLLPAAHRPLDLPSSACRVAAAAAASGRPLGLLLSNRLLDLLAKCGALPEARRLFDSMPHRDLCSWNTLIGGYSSCGDLDEVRRLFDRMPSRDHFSWSTIMLRAGVRPNGFTFAGVLDALSELAMEGPGRQVHGHMMRAGYDPFSFSASALVHMYSKCGNIDRARAVFEGMPKPDLVSWTSMVSGYAQNGYPEEAIRYFELMLQAGTRPDHIAFVGVLSACTHAGLVDKGLEIFHSIKDEHGMEHTADHYACVVDLLSRAGRFEEAEEIMDKMLMKPDKFLWASLLGGCRIHKNVRLGEQAAEALFEIEPVEKVRKTMDRRRVVKKPGSSWIEVKRRVHVFLVGGKSHPRTEDIHAQLEKLHKRMKEEGYVPDTEFVLHDVEDEQKEESLAYHSERLAVAFGIIATPQGTPVKVFKNLRICGDCHTAFKFFSRITQRVIIVRDSSRFHRFKEGSCSCGDYW